MSERLRVGVIGAGHFGRYHAQKYAARDDCDLVAVVDSDLAAAQKLSAATGGQPHGDLRSVLDKLDAVSVAVPTNAHAEVAIACLDAGIHVLLEKPIADDVATADAIITAAAGSDAILQIGHLERFSTAFEAITERVGQPLFIECQRVAAFQPRGTDVNVVLDIMIHDIDLIMALIASPVLSVDAVGAPVVSQTEDIVNTRIRFENGAAANITASRVSLQTKREIRIFELDRYIKADLVTGTLTSRRRGSGEMAPGIPNIVSEERQIAKGDSLEREIGAFLSVARGQGAVAVSGEDGREAVRVAKMIEDSLRENRDRLKRAHPDLAI